MCHLQNTAYCIQDNELDIKSDTGIAVHIYMSHKESSCTLLYITCIRQIYQPSDIIDLFDAL